MIDLSFRVHNARSDFSQVFNRFFSSLNELVSQADSRPEQLNLSGEPFQKAIHDMTSGTERKQKETDLIAIVTDDEMAQAI